MATYTDLYQVDAFTETPFNGNPAGVVLDAGQITPDIRQKIARELNCSETAFVTQTGQTTFRFRYYTPETEVDLCGHATIATLHTLHEQSGLTGEILVNTNVGDLPMRIEADGTAWMRQAAPQYRDIDETTKSRILDSLGLTKDELDANLPFGLAFTGLWDIMLPLPTRQSVHALQPNFDALAKVSKQLGAASVHIYAFDPVDQQSTLHTRDFSPAVGVNEDPHTGTANGALGALLVHHGVLKPGQFIFEQGWSIGRPGHILVEVTPDMQVFVGGRAVTTITGRLRLS
ncbi:PhzF family phenazine biosynthesis protein [Alicyclobacillus dauci]|uniref:PhzF family phenazine biosynthesis protein n=1 Tax=Alicyclobacillus dauci TaxID=1475485 RepID=A0ABY6Z554_9BACL|nr:PhzF family phenazine biosynthesis protein [Alicyclobacillus dauci]WAH37653.1 PhzF family phenazine biosynthesis protein [Alicyclobacillus dauci]